MYSKNRPSVDQWLCEAKADPLAPRAGMYLIHNGVVRSSPRSRVREGNSAAPDVTGMDFSFDQDKVDEVIRDTRSLEGIFYVRVWLNQGSLKVGDDLMLVLVGGDIRPHVVDALSYLVGRIKAECVREVEL